jgi:hypothetical protein
MDKNLRSALTNSESAGADVDPSGKGSPTSLLRNQFFPDCASPTNTSFAKNEKTVRLDQRVGPVKVLAKGTDLLP